jgi:hypothetical protein
VESHLVVYVAVNNKNLFNAILETILTTGYWNVIFIVQIFFPE